MHTLHGACRATEDWGLQDVILEGEVNGNAAVWAGEAVQGIWGQPAETSLGWKALWAKAMATK